ncbi:T9SS type B sorting domain-containing protein [Pseudochryseolinea flava]|nr:gliding motility-associated C-terminal domain-containing protein [Pseudochryseolinea flava]
MKASLYFQKLLRQLSLLLLFLCSLPFGVFATHMRAGNILLEKVIPNDCSDRRYKIRIIAYIDTESTVPFGGSTSDVLAIYGRSHEAFMIQVPEIKSTNGDGTQFFEIIDADRHIARVEFVYFHEFPGNDVYTITFTEINRNAGILNMSRSVDTPFFIETKITLDSYLGCSTPALIEVPPVDRACSGIMWTHTPGAVDLKDSISYELQIPKSGPLTLVGNYASPERSQFYSSIDYSKANEKRDGFPTFVMDPRSGLITWDAPGNTGEYNIAFHIIEWRKVDNVWYRMGYVRRDMQIIVEDGCDHNRPDLEVPPDTCVVAGTLLKETIWYWDQFLEPPKLPGILNPINIKAYSPVFLRGATTIPHHQNEDYLPGKVKPGYPMEFTWQTECDDVHDQPFYVNFKVTDQGDPQLATFKTWRIRVIGPPPRFNDRTLNVSTRTATLKWDPYVCQNAETMQVWRRVDSVGYTGSVCETGMPPGLGYELIGTVPINQSAYVDNNSGKGLAPGAQYCYRLVAIFPSSSGGGESIVSSDTCLAPFVTKDPIMTKVSIRKTDLEDGIIDVQWHKPLDTTVPQPYKYEVYRSEGFTRGNDSTLVATVDGSMNDVESITDSNLNTEEKVYNYSVTLYKDGNPIGWSPTASTVRLTNESELGKINLFWSATVPWSNSISDDGAGTYMHKIYRGVEGATDDELVEIATIDPTAAGLFFSDNGPFEANKDYCYRVETFGSYGNDDLPTPLPNFSQMICTEPGDSIPPCVPELTVELAPCEALIESGQLCNANNVTNTITWEKPTSEDCDDIRKYHIWVSNTKGGTYTKRYTVPATTTTFSEDTPTFARCYRIQAEDDSKNLSELSNEVCNDNCPMYVLPNVFTPNGDELNDVFSAFNIRNLCNEDDCSDVPLKLRRDCARFVEDVKFTVFNRWGQQVYTYQSDTGPENTIYIDWDGKDNSGKMVEPGVYYYAAEVKFVTADPAASLKVYKSWVQVIYNAN